MRRDPPVLRSDALLRTTLHCHIEVLHHGILTAPSKLLIDMGLIHLLLNICLKAKCLLHFRSELGHPGGLGSRLHLKVLIIGGGIHILGIIHGKAGLSMLLLLKLLDLMHGEVIW